MRIWIAASLLVLSCTDRKTEERAVSVDSTSVVERLSNRPSGDSVLAARGSDTVRLTVSNSVRTLLWTAVDGQESIERYRSGDLFSGLPLVELRDVDSDGLFDLFVAWRYEEQASGVLLRARAGSGAEVLYRSADNICSAPELARQSDAGGPLIIEYEPGAVSMSDCRYGGPLATCVDNYFVEWPRMISPIGHGAGLAADTSSAVALFYTSVVARYERSLRELRANLAADPRAICDAALVGRVESLRLRAQRLAEGR